MVPSDVLLVGAAKAKCASSAAATKEGIERNNIFTRRVRSEESGLRRELDTTILSRHHCQYIGLWSYTFLISPTYPPMCGMRLWHGFSFSVHGETHGFRSTFIKINVTISHLA